MGQLLALMNSVCQAYLHTAHINASINSVIVAFIPFGVRLHDCHPPSLHGLLLSTEVRPVYLCNQSLVFFR